MGRAAAGYRSSGARSAKAAGNAAQSKKLFATALDEAEAVTDTTQAAGFRALVLQRRAIAFLRDDPGEAASDARHSAECFAGIGDLAHGAQSRWVEGDARRLAGDDAGARESLADGLRLAEQAKASGLTQSIGAALRALETPPPASTDG